MKKILLCLTLLVVAIQTFAQTNLSSVVKIGYQTGMKRVGVGLDARYEFQNNFRIVPEIVFFFPKEDITGLDINLDLQYLIELSQRTTFYPLMGGALDNNYYRRKGESNEDKTHFGFNLGAGIDYHLNKKNYLNAQFRYTLNKYNYGFFTVGYGFKF